MAQVSSTNTIRTPNDSSRRRFLTVAAAASAVGAGSLAMGAAPTSAPQCFLADDSELLELEKEIFASREKAQAFDPEIMRLSEIWEGELSRLEAEFNAGRSTLTTFQRWEAVKEMPESAEHTRLAALQRPHYDAYDAALERMFALPAQTAEGRAAKATVVLGLMADIGYDEDEGDYPLNLVRQLLTELAQVRPCES
jgi:hypothetical protein